MTQELHPTSANKTVVFYSPLDGTDILVRTGSSFRLKNSESKKWRDLYLPLLHAVFCAYSPAYVKADTSTKDKLVSKAVKMIDPVVRKHLKKSPETKPKLPSFNKVFIENLEKQYATQDDFHQLISELVPLSVFEVIFEENNDKSFSSLDIDTVLQFLSNSLPKETEKKRKEFCLKKLQSLLETTLTNSEKDYSEIKKNLSQKTLTDISPDVFINLLSKNLKRNIYILDYTNRMPKKIKDQKRTDYDKSIILLQFPDCYETVGRLLEKNRVQREFLDDSIVDKIVAFLFDRKLKKKYPELTEYLPKERTESNENENQATCSESGSGSESESDSESKSESGSESESESKSETESPDPVLKQPSLEENDRSNTPDHRRKGRRKNRRHK